MACLLEKGDILDVYSDIYESILSRINGSIKTKFSPEQYIKDFHNEIAESNDPKFALEVAQAIPEIMLQVIATRKNIREYFVKNKISQDSISEMSLTFEDFNAIKIFVSGQKKSLDEQKQKIIRKNKSKENIEILDPTDTTINYSNVQKKGKVEDPLTNSGQFAIAYNPDEVTKEEQDTPDPEKEMFYTVIKQIILISEQKPTDTDEVIYQGVSLAQRPVSIKNFPTKPDGTTLLVDDDVKFLEKNPDYNGLLNVITDTDGNYVYFTEKGDITNESEGRLVYQYVRDIVLKDGKLILTNRSGFAYTLVSPENIIERKNNAYKQIHTIGMLQADKDVMLKKERAQQKKRINDLYRLHNYMKENPDEAVVLRITGGSFGNFKNKYIPIAETGLKLDDINLPFIGGGKSGYIQVEIAQDLPGISVKHPVYLQRGDINEDLADKIATILTTKARYRGEELSPLAKRTYAEIFLGDNVVVRDTNKIKNNIEILTPEINGITTLTVSINDVPVYLDSPNAKEEIKKHLLAAIPNKNGQIYPANLNYSQAYIGIGKTFTDYIVSGEKITKKEVNYFDFIKPMMKIEYSAESASFFVNSNAYLSYSIPSSIMPAGKKNFDLASVTPASKKTVKAKIDNEVNEIINEDDVKVEPGEVVYNLKKITAAYQVNANIINAGVTLNIGTDLEIGLAKIAKTKARKYVPITLSKKAKAKKDFPNVAAVASAIVNNLNKYKSDTVHAIGNNIAELGKSGYSQTDIDTVVYQILDKIVNSNELIEPVTKIVTIGESGVSEAVIKAAKKLGIGVEVTVPSGWTFSVPWAKGKTGVYTISNKDEFLSRFGDAPTKTNAKRKVAKTANQYNRVAATIAKKKATSNKTYGTRKKAPAKKTPATIKQQDAQVNTVSSMSLTERLKQKKDIFNSKDSDKLNRIENLERKLGGFFERLITTKAERDSILDWWGTNPLSKAIPLDIITQVVNSNSFATWSQYGITLHMANKATPIDLYHEAWHGFSQLFLTMDEKTALYDEIRKSPKWAEASYFDVEEALAEDYRNYTRDNTLFTGVLGKIFKKVRDFLRMMFGKVTGQDMMQLRDIAVVKDLFDKLYKGEILDLKPSIDNIMFTKLNRARTIENFSIDETDKAVKLIDNFLGLEIAYYNDKNSSTTGAVRVFSDVENRLKAYESVNKQIEYTIEYSIEQYEALLEKDPTNIEEQEKLKNNIDLLSRILDNYGNPELALSNKDKSSVVAFQMKKSRFKIIQEELLEDPSDLENTRVLQDYKGNVINPKNLARPETLMIISSVVQVEKDENGNVTEVLDVFGVPQLDDVDNVWKKLAKVLEGSFDYAEMYERLVKYSENYPEFLQIIDNLRHPGNLEVTDSLQFAIETNFFKDLKKPRIRHIQYNINKTILEKEKYDEEGRKIKDEVSSYDSVVTTASFDTHAVIKDWKANFITASIDINPYIKEDTDGNPILNTEKVINDFGDDRGVFIQSKAREFLEAFGVYMDRSSSELNTIFENTLNVTTAFKLTLVFDTIKLVHQAAQSTDFNKVAAAETFKKDPLSGLIKGLPKELREDEKQSNDIRSSIRILAELQTQYSDGYSNFSVLSPDGNRVWEQVVDNTITRVVTSINYAKTWQELTSDEQIQMVSLNI
jgi:tetratricopeptide (TPR) repeat protein